MTEIIETTIVETPKAKKSTVKKETTVSIVTLTFEHDKETKGTHRFAEAVKDGVRPTVGTVYILKSALTNDQAPKKITVIISKGHVKASLSKEAIVLNFVQDKETKGTFRYAEIAKDGVRPFVGTLYILKTVIGTDAPKEISVVINLA